jgi:hypothetical protein
MTSPCMQKGGDRFCQGILNVISLVDDENMPNLSANYIPINSSIATLVWLLCNSSQFCNANRDVCRRIFHDALILWWPPIALSASVGERSVHTGMGQDEKYVTGYVPGYLYDYPEALNSLYVRSVLDISSDMLSIKQICLLQTRVRI